MKIFRLIAGLTLMLANSVHAVTYLDPPYDFANQAFSQRGALMNPTDGTRALNLLVVYIQLDDFVYTGKDTNYISNWVFSTSPGSTSIAMYLQQASRGAVNLTPARESSGSSDDGIVIVDGGDTHSTATNPRVWRRMALDLANPFIDYSYYDDPANGGDGNGTVSNKELTILVIVGNNTDCGQDGGVADDGNELDGVNFSGRSIAMGCDGHTEGYIAWAHEYMHQAYNYNKDLYGYGIGDWDLMGGNMGASAFTKLMLGWTPPTVITRDGWYTLRHALVSPDMLLLHNPDRGYNEYFLVENRIGTGAGDLHDAPDSGLLIQRVDTSHWKSSHPSESPLETIRPDGKRLVPSCAEFSVLASAAERGDRTLTVEHNYFAGFTPPFDVHLTQEGEAHHAEKAEVISMRGNVLTLADADELEFTYDTGTKVIWERRSLSNWFSSELSEDVPKGAYRLPLKRMAGTPPPTSFWASVGGVDLMIDTVIGSDFQLSTGLYPDGMPQEFNEGHPVVRRWGPTCSGASNTDAWDTAGTTPHNSGTFDAKWADGSDARINIYGIGPAAETTEIYVDVPSNGPSLYLERKLVHRMNDTFTLEPFPWVVANTGDDIDTYRFEIYQQNTLTDGTLRYRGWDSVDIALGPSESGVLDVELAQPTSGSYVPVPEGLELKYRAFSLTDPSIISEGVLPLDWPFPPDRISRAYVSNWYGRAPDSRIFSTDIAGPGVTRSADAVFSGGADSLTISPRGDTDQFTVTLPDIARRLPPLLPPDVTPPDSVPDCGTLGSYELPGPFGPETLEVRSVLEVRIVPNDNYSPSFDDLKLEGAPPILNTRLVRRFDCPYGRVTGTGPGTEFSTRQVHLELYPVEERLQRYAYELKAEYKVQMLRVPGDSIFRQIAKDNDGRGIPCIGGFFPICEPDEFGRVSTLLPPTLLHPPGCPADGCPDHFVFAWQGKDAQSLQFSAPVGTKITVLDAFGTFIAEALPAKPFEPISPPPLTDGFVSLLPPSYSLASIALTPIDLNSLPPPLPDQEPPPPPSPYIPDPVIPVRVAYELPVEQLVEGLYFLQVQVPPDFDLETDPAPVTLSWTPTDSDGDGHLREFDNCPDTFNPNQSDFDSDTIGDACDGDIDGDGTVNDTDVCPSTSASDVVEPGTGCSIAQLCPCEGPFDTTTPWRRHGNYVSCVSKTSKRFVRHNLITSEERDAIVYTAAESLCGTK